MASLINNLLSLFVIIFIIIIIIVFALRHKNKKESKKQKLLYDILSYGSAGLSLLASIANLFIMNLTNSNNNIDKLKQIETDLLNIKDDIDIKNNQFDNDLKQPPAELSDDILKQLIESEKTNVQNSQNAEPETPETPKDLSQMEQPKQTSQNTSQKTSQNTSQQTSQPTSQTTSQNTSQIKQTPQQMETFTQPKEKIVITQEEQQKLAKELREKLL